MKKDFNDYYNRFPDERLRHQAYLDRLESTEETIMNKVLAKKWLRVAIINEHWQSCKILLDRLGSSDDHNMSLQERIAAHLLLEEEDDDG